MVTAAPADPVESFPAASEATFDYFAYGSCMCPLDLQRTLGEDTCRYVVGPSTLKGYRLEFSHRSRRRDCGVLNMVPAAGGVVEGVLYRIPWRLSHLLDEREEIPQGGYRHESVEVVCQHLPIQGVRTYVVVNPLSQELPPNDWYFGVVMRGATTCRLSESYCWKLFEHMRQLQQRYAALQPAI